MIYGQVLLDSTGWVDHVGVAIEPCRFAMFLILLKLSCQASSQQDACGYSVVVSFVALELNSVSQDPYCHRVVTFQQVSSSAIPTQRHNEELCIGVLKVRKYSHRDSYVVIVRLPNDSRFKTCRYFGVSYKTPCDLTISKMAETYSFAASGPNMESCTRA